MEVADLLPLVERLDYNLDDLEEALGPLLERSLEETSKKLPLLERAKLHVLLTFTLESLLYSYLSVHGVDAKQHPVFKELTRVKQYIAKITALESEPDKDKDEKPTMKLDQQAARRFIKHGLAGNDQYDIERAERLAKEKARVQLKAAMLAKQSKDESVASSPSHASSKPSASATNSDSDAESQFESDYSEAESPAQQVDNNRDTQTSKSDAPEEFIQLSSEPVLNPEATKKGVAKQAKAKMEKQDKKRAIEVKKSERQAKKAARQAKKEGKEVDDATKKDQALMKKEKRRKHEAKKKAKRDREKQKGTAN